VNLEVSKNWLIGISSVFIATLALALYLEFYYWLFIPVVCILGWLAIFRLDKLFMVVVFATPLSLNLEDLEMGGLGMYLPTEPLLACIMLLFLARQLMSSTIDKRLLRHPITVLITVHLLWLLVTSVTSTMPLVSFKFLVARMWFVFVMYFLGVEILKYTQNTRTFLWVYIIPLCAVVIYTTINHTLFEFDEKAAHWVMSPFYKDHTSYGAILAMYFPVVLGFMFFRRYQGQRRYLVFLGLIIITFGLVLSYTRAAWISVLCAGVVFIVLHYKVKLSTIILGFTTLAAVLIIFQSDIVRAFEKNKQDSSDDLVEHVQSISNITSDASNLERLNRWNAAYGMFKEKPVLGWGPGTYAFLYAPFQHSTDLTIISTNFGDLGNAHSEYLGPLCESGFLGSLIFLALVITVIITAVRLYKRLENGEVKMLVLLVFLGLVTYLIHGTLNNYLDTDKASIPFWGFIAIIVAVDIFHKDKLKEPAA